MKLIRLTSLVALCLCTGAGLPAFAADKMPALPGPQQLSDAFAGVSERVRPTVVTVYSEKTIKMPRGHSPFGENSPFQFFFGEEDGQPRRAPQQRQYKQGGMGSGIIVDKEGHILTNNHVVSDVDEIKVKMAGGATYDAKVIGADPKSDLAVIQIEGKLPKDMTFAELGDSDKLRVGDWVLAIGAPFGYDQTVTAGIISAKGRSGVDHDTSKYEDFLQTDAAINPGNSGGPLVNMEGKVIGINTAIATGGAGQFAGVGFAIPVSMAKHVMDDLIKDGRVTRGYLGVIIQPLNAELAEQFDVKETKGVLIAQVTKDSPAEKANLKIGDVVLRYQGAKVEDIIKFRRLVADTAPGTKAELVVLRSGKERNIKAEVGELPGDDEAPVTGKRSESRQTTTLGITAETLTADKAKDLDLEEEKGVLVTDVIDDGPAGQAGLQAGDVITEVNHQKVATLGELKDAVTKAKEKGSLLMLVKTKGASRFVIIKVK